MNKYFLSVVVYFFLIISNSSFSANYTSQEGQSAYDSKNYSKAFRIWYLLSLEDNPHAEYGLGLLYLNGFEHLKKDISLAVNYFKKAHIDGITAASYQLGLLYEVGDVVEKKY